MFMKVPLIKVIQKKEEIYISKLKVKELKKLVVLNFRYPYLETLKDREQQKFVEYLEGIEKRGLRVSYGPERVQRQLQLLKLESIAKYIRQSDNFLPNALILGCFNKKIENRSIEEDYESFIDPVNEELGMYKIELNEDYELTAIDGQHRLAGLFSSEDKDIDNMELPIVLLFGVSLSTSAKVFVDINSTQKAVDKSLIYDLAPMLDSNQAMKLNNKEIEIVQNCHRICITLYNNEKSPLYKQIRMLGTGEGAVSQAFLVEEIYPLVYNGILSNYDLSTQFNILLNYFNAIREVFPDDWPVSIGDINLSEKAHYVLKEKKSQLPKTLGIGAMLKVFPRIFNQVDKQIPENKDDKTYYRKLKSLFIEELQKIQGKIVWSQADHKEAIEQGKEVIYIEGSNRVAINNLAEEILKVINLYN
ncbi:DGQHR domain-containing protein [Bacillus thuringiensis]|nr:DGQHR domain-containing protein [Bacillus cereus]MDR4365821.1 DGQHR domain-containing protein [Bacillus cereus]PER84790.1 DGQHR domain-containing protein [Bacillus thuringiensis]PFE28775.1 DGQHR domain-containing protein [Bacillus anthracis]PGS46087.1 DGQHR domain-containing protein [Bacillus thuringiensis]